MQYRYLTKQDVLNTYLNRIYELEAEHFKNCVYLEEAELLKDENTAVTFRQTLAGIEMRIENLFEQAQELSKPAVEENSVLEEVVEEEKDIEEEAS
jgi:hypothetical protein